MSKEIIGMPWLEWRSLAGLADPYSLVSAEVGVPRVMSISMTEGAYTEGEYLEEAFMPKEQTPKQKRRGDIARLVRVRKAKASKVDERPARERLRGQMKAKAAPVLNKMDALRAKLGLKARGSHQTEDLQYEEYQHEELFGFFLEDNGISLNNFHDLLDEVLEHGNEADMTAMLVIEDEFEEALGTMLKSAGKAVATGVGKAVGTVSNIPTQINRAKTALKKSYDDGKASTQIPVAPPPAAVAPAAVAPAQAAPAQAAPAQAAPAQAAPAQAAPAQAAPAQAAPAQAAPAQAAPAAKKPGLLRRAVGFVGRKTMGAVRGAARGAIAASVDDGNWDEFLSERGITLGQFHVLMDEAMESGDQDEIDTILAVEDLFGQWLEATKKEKKANQAKGLRATAGRAGVPDPDVDSIPQSVYHADPRTRKSGTAAGRAAEKKFKRSGKKDTSYLGVGIDAADKARDTSYFRRAIQKKNA